MPRRTNHLSSETLFAGSFFESPDLDLSNILGLTQVLLGLGPFQVLFCLGSFQSSANWFLGPFQQSP